MLGLCAGLMVVVPAVSAGSAKDDWRVIMKSVEAYDQAVTAESKGGGGADLGRLPPPRQLRDQREPGINQLALLQFQLEDFIANHPTDKRWMEARAYWVTVAPRLAAGLGQDLDEARWNAEVAALTDVADLPDAAAVRLELAVIDRQLQRGRQTGMENAEWESLLHRMERFVEKFPREPRSAPVALLAAKILQRVDEARATKMFAVAKGSRNLKVATEATAGLAVLPWRHAPADLQFKAADGRMVDLADLRGQVVIVDFWASWCPPCVDEAPELVALYRKYRDQGLAVVGVSLDQDRRKMEAFAAKTGMDWPHYFDGGGWDTKLSRKFGISSIPTLWIFDREGRLVTDEGRDELEQRVARLLARSG